MPLVALDLDGTLLDLHGHLPPGHRHAVTDLRRLGARVAIVTGRPLLTARAIHRDLGLDSPIACFNGGWVGWTGGRCLWASWLPAAAVRATVAAVAGIEASVCAYPDADTWIMDRTVAHTRGWAERYGCRIRIDAAAFAAWDRPSLKIMVPAAPALIPGLLLRLRDRLGAGCEIVASQDDRIEIMPPGITKAVGLARLAAHYRIPQACVWAAGDADNDLEMVRWAGHGCIMGAATPRLRAVARHRLPSARERGLCALVPLVAAHGAG
jgi:Cof subfamily protein (haloacid dehalogenase superfamily)